MVTESLGHGRELQNEAIGSTLPRCRRRCARKQPLELRLTTATRGLPALPGIVTTLRQAVLFVVIESDAIAEKIGNGANKVGGRANKIGNRANQVGN